MQHDQGKREAAAPAAGERPASAAPAAGERPASAARAAGERPARAAGERPASAAGERPVTDAPGAQAEPAPEPPADQAPHLRATPAERAAREAFAELFDVPEAARDYLPAFFTDAEMDFVYAMGAREFTRAEAAAHAPGDVDAFLAACYRRGVVSLADGCAAPGPDARWRIADFYSRLDIFSISETERWRSIPREARLRIEAWYFDAYYDGLDPDPAVRPTPDEVLPLQETLDFIDAQDRPIYLNFCDCRSLLGDCGSPREVCITYKDGPNTFAARGLSRSIDKEQAKDIVRAADKAGLMHTVNPNGICNCCSDCCYLFRSQARRDSAGFWPRADRVIALDVDACIGCGKCARRCHFSVIERAGKRQPVRLARLEACVGCGICATACPTGALTLKERVFS